MRSRCAALVLLFGSALACVACGLDGAGIELGVPDGPESLDGTLRDGPQTSDQFGPDDSIATDGTTPEDHSSHDATADHGEPKDGGHGPDGVSDAPGLSDAADSHPADAPKESSGKDGGLDASGEAGKDAPGADAPGDASIDSPGTPEAGTDAGDSGSGGMTYACDDGGTTTDCLTGCSGKPVACVFCAAFNPNEGFCGADDTSCSDPSLPFGYGACSCFLGGCVASNQICSGFYAYDCLSCGEPGTDGQSCGGGGTCDQSTATCM